MANFADLKPTGHKEYWDKIRPEILNLLEEINKDVFEGKWRLETDQIQVSESSITPLISENAAALSSGFFKFIVVCVENDAKSIRIYYQGGGYWNVIRYITQENFVGALKRSVQMLLHNLG